MFATQAEPAIQLKEIHAGFVPGTFGWVFEDDGFKAFMDGSPILWISGPPGIGKSCVAHSIIGKLLESTSSDPRASVAYYFFREEHEELRSAKNMLKAAVIQTAIGDGKYRDEIVAEMKAKGQIGGDVDEIWRRCFVERYPKDAEQKLYLVLDGLDEADEKDRKQMLKIMEDIKRDELGIQASHFRRALLPLTSFFHISPISKSNGTNSLTRGYRSIGCVYQPSH
jgi:DNA polymerase III delta prime subunit